ncbi:MAG: hypothetical protein K6L80_10380 [Agarilytica sp.]
MPTHISALFTAAIATLLLVGCYGDDDDQSCGQGGLDNVTLSGEITYDFVTHNDNGSLNYNDIERRAIRGATVELLDRNGNVSDTTTTNESGAYSFSAPSNTALRTRVKAELRQNGTPAWNIRITDNTEGDALYTMEGSLACTTTSDQVRDLHAGSGWTGSEYGSARVAAPFAILDSVYQALQLLVDTDPDIQLSPVELRWSTRNRAVSGSASQGNIGTSSYNGENIHILGDADNDTDEFDRSIIQHEFAHYLEDTISRSDTIGGRHSQITRTDMRVSFSEGLANAFTAIASGSGIYEDSLGTEQSGGFRISLESNSIANFGWYSENSTGLIVYDIYDSTNDGDDTLSLGFTPIYDALTSSDYRTGIALTSIYSFTSALRDNVSSNAQSELTTLIESQEIYGNDALGSNETNDGELSYTLPIYHSLSIGGGALNLCSSAVGERYNGFDVRRFATLEIDSNDNYVLRAEKTSGTGDSDPDILVHQSGALIAQLISGNIDSEEAEVSLSAGSYIVEFFDADNVSSSTTAVLSCFDLSINTGNN